MSSDHACPHLGLIRRPSFLTIHPCEDCFLAGLTSGRGKLREGVTWASSSERDPAPLASRPRYVDAYPKAGAPNPIVDLFVYDLGTRNSTRMDIRDGQPFTNDVVGHYAYRIEWSPDGRELTPHRTNRRQNALEFAACDPGTGACRVVVREEWPASWVANHPPRQFLADGRRFLWISERAGVRNLYLYDLREERPGPRRRETPAPLETKGLEA